MKGEDFIQCRRKVNKSTTREYLPLTEGQKYPSQKLPLEERWSARNFDFKLIFENVDDKEAKKVELEWFYDISSWEEYKSFLGSGNFIKKPIKNYRGKKWIERQLILKGLK